MDTWCAAHTIAAPTVRAGGDTWYFITADYTFGHTLENDATAFIRAAGGRVVGSTSFPFRGLRISPEAAALQDAVEQARCSSSSASWKRSLPWSAIG
jgi:hypothetical protein